MRLLIIIISKIIIFFIFYLSWLSNPNIGDVLPTPKWLSQWINENGNVRTAVPFAFLGILGEVWLIGKKNKTRLRGWIWLYLVLVVTCSEVGQLWLPMRHFDVCDIIYGGLGAMMGIFGTKLGLFYGNIILRSITKQ